MHLLEHRLYRLGGLLFTVTALLFAPMLVVDGLDVLFSFASGIPEHPVRWHPIGCNKCNAAVLHIVQQWTTFIRIKQVNSNPIRSSGDCIHQDMIPLDDAGPLWRAMFDEHAYTAVWLR